MTIVVGNLSLGLAVLTALLAMLLSVAAARFGSDTLLRAARRAMVLLALLLSIASGMLLSALVDSDFRLNYVARFTERALPLGYKLAAFWAGQEGSILLWAWLIAVMAVVLGLTQRRQFGTEYAVTVATLAAVSAFFASLMVFAGANPFAEAATVVADGHGLNPLLQDPGMIAHPPALFVGYAGFTVPFAMMVGALVAGRRDNLWLAGTRRWLLTSWMFLTLGILLGAQWAYVELGWGGYWAWDPVENASLLPWLTGTALLHSVMAQQHRGTLKVWNVAQIAMAFLLCIFGTFITRSGVVQSVHSFGASLIGTFFLVFLLLGMTFSAALFVVRRDLLRTERPIDSFFSREGAFLATNVLLLVMMLTTLVGTIFPIISGLFMPKGVSVGQPFYNKIVVPMSLLLVGLMAMGPLLTYGKPMAGRLRRGLLFPAICAHGAMLVLLAYGIRNLWMVGVAMIAVIAILTILQDFILGLIERVRGGENPLAALVRLLGANQRRYGAQIVHLGVIMIVVGIAGSSIYGQKRDLKFSPGQTQSVGDQKVTFKDLTDSRKVNYTTVEAEVVVTDPAGRQTTLRPERRFYDKSENSLSEVAIRSTLAGDFYVALAGWENRGQTTALQVIYNPLVCWIWIGGLVMMGGALIGLLPRLELKR